ncbi:hypothetical protein BgiMline_021133, partial [Biomphalaria glabrata]
SKLQCAAWCSQIQECVYYRTVDFKDTPDPRDRLCYIYGLPPTITVNSFKFLGPA